MPDGYMLDEGLVVKLSVSHFFELLRIPIAFYVNSRGRAVQFLKIVGREINTS
jgi:hypothetical protein